MSTLHKFVLYAPDVNDSLQRRLAVRPTHLENAHKLTLEGSLVSGGAMLSPESIASPTAEKKMVGSVIIYAAESLEACRKIVESDIYYTSGVVLDKESLVLLPFMGASLSPKPDASSKV
ncbi:hypothetical protein B0H21DRAFT_703925 [Amylocystis lapponica]|nr:hypothetical protein B0H21DRAFT_703925 [Amylocystis lapponica]